jgi:hypothetical protein
MHALFTPISPLPHRTYVALEFQPSTQQCLFSNRNWTGLRMLRRLKSEQKEIRPKKDPSVVWIVRGST